MAHGRLLAHASCCLGFYITWLMLASTHLQAATRAKAPQNEQHCQSERPPALQDCCSFMHLSESRRHVQLRRTTDAKRNKQI